MTALEIEFITTDRCPRKACPDCGRAERALREVAAERGVPVPQVRVGSRIHTAAGVSAGATIVVRHVACDEAPAALAGREPPLLRVNGRIVLSGSKWGDVEMRDAFRKALGFG